jgi:hypothetical protein
MLCRPDLKTNGFLKLDRLKRSSLETAMETSVTLCPCELKTTRLPVNLTV